MGPQLAEQKEPAPSSAGNPCFDWAKAPIPKVIWQTIFSGILVDVDLKSWTLLIHLNNILQQVLIAGVP
nr:hypothetical protein [Pedobacter sp. ASV2]